MTSRRARELRLPSSRTASDRPLQPWRDTPTAPGDDPAAASSPPALLPLPPLGAARLRRAAGVTLGLVAAAVAVLLTALVAGLPLLPAAVAAGVLLAAARGVPLVVHVAHLREVRRRGVPSHTEGLDPERPTGGTAA